LRTRPFPPRQAADKPLGFRRPWGVRAIGPTTAACLLLALLAAVSGCLRAEHPPTPAFQPAQSVPLPAWDQAFRTADPRWQGADSVSSVPLSPSRDLWLFGDTWIAPADSRGREQAVIVRNTLAIQNITGGKPGQIDLFWKEGPSGPEAVFGAGPGPAWLWPLSGARQGSQICLFFIRLVPTDTGLGFELNGSVVIRVANPDDPPGSWQTQIEEIPFFHHGPAGDLYFGCACLSWEGFVYVYGVREDWDRGAEGRFLLVARVPAVALESADFSQWRFSGADGWEAEVEKAAPFFDGAATEMSVSFLPGLERFAAVYTFCGLSKEVLARFAPGPAGPWGAPVLVWECPEVSWNRGYFCYAGKAHPELATSKNELIISYAANSYELKDHLQDPRIYWPRFARVTFRPPGPP
jgi:hypothetical protein